MTQPTSATSAFDSIAPLYDRFAHLTEHAFRSWLEEVLPERVGTAVDLGCGTGQFHDLLSARCRTVLGVDSSEGQLAIAQGKEVRPNVTYRLLDLRGVDASVLGRFDLVFSVTAMHHLGDQAQALQFIRSLVRPGGHVVVIDCVRTAPRWVGAAQPARFAVYRWLRTLKGSLATLAATRSWADAALMFKLRTHPAWRALARSSKALSRDEFHRVYRQELPGALITDLGPAVCAASWRATG